MNEKKSEKREGEKNENWRESSEQNTPTQDDNVNFFGIEKFLHEPTRLQIIAHLNAAEKADMIFLKNTLGLTWGNLSFHITKLEEKGYITVEKQFIGKKPYTLLQITEEGKKSLVRY
jgi:DNA-binding transcriptional ArsR family regulator